jgi:uncharacterized protein (DUF952 family)
MIYRIAEAADWQAALVCGVFASADLALEGFIHCSEREQVLRSAQKYYAGRRDLQLLEIDEAKLGDALRREDLPGRVERFPHVYAPIPLAAIVRHMDFSPTADGCFILPSTI